MKSSFIIAILAAGALTACAPAMEDKAMAKPTAADQFIGKSLSVGEDTVFLFQPDGVVGGTMRGEPLVGEYEADATEICSTYSSPAALAGREFCSTPQVDGDTVIFLRRDGSTSPAYTIDG